jgi:uncharacterized protein YcbK (DUF882 family)
MVAWLGLFLSTVLTSAPAADPAAPQNPPAQGFVAEALVPVSDERDADLVPPLRERSKKELWLAEKAHRPDVHVTDEQLRPPRVCHAGQKPLPRQPCAQAAERLAGPTSPVGTRVQPLTTLHNQWTRELMTFIPGQPYLERFRSFLRDHFTNQATNIDPELADVLVSAALHFRAPRIDVVSGYRSPKYNMILRKKGHQVARESQHMQGNAVDFRIRGVPTEKLLGFVRSLRLGGVGFYPHAHFVHSDTGRIRYWQGS